MSTISSKVKNGADWFYWIAALSLINTAIIFTNGKINFIFGLGITQIIDYVCKRLSDSSGDVSIIIGIILSLLISGVFVLFGYKANKGFKWSFVAGMILYVLDGLIFLYAEDFISIAFHIFALGGMYNGYRALVKFNNVAKYQGENISEQQII